MTFPSTPTATPIPLDVTSLQSVSETLGGTPAGPAGTPSTGAPGTPPEGAGSTDTPSPFGNLWMLAAIGAVIWFLIFAPERKARKQRDQMLGALKKGDRVVTTGGLHAQVVEVRENEVVLKAGDVRLTYSRSSVHQVLGGGEDDKG